MFAGLPEEYPSDGVIHVKILLVLKINSCWLLMAFGYKQKHFVEEVSVKMSLN